MSSLKSSKIFGIVFHSGIALWSPSAFSITTLSDQYKIKIQVGPLSLFFSYFQKLILKDKKILFKSLLFLCGLAFLLDYLPYFFLGRMDNLLGLNLNLDNFFVLLLIGLLRVLLFVTFLKLFSTLKVFQRGYEFHGAERKVMESFKGAYSGSSLFVTTLLTLLFLSPALFSLMPFVSELPSILKLLVLSLLTLILAVLIAMILIRYFKISNLTKRLARVPSEDQVHLVQSALKSLLEAEKSENIELREIDI